MTPLSAVASRNLSSLVLDYPADFASRLAVRQGGESLSYEDLRGCVLAFAAGLRELGIGRGDRAVLAIENSLDYVVGLFAVLVCGVVAVPVNPDTTRAALGRVLQECGARALLIRERTWTRLQPDLGPGCRPVLLGHAFAANRARYYGGAPARLDVAAEQGDPALVLFTSGTTGEPKGVMLTHGNLLANTASIVEYMRLRSEDSTVAVLPFFHSFGNSVLLTHLMAGGAVTIENRFSFPQTVVETLQRVRPSGFSGVPTTFYVLLNRTTFLQHDWGFLRYVSQAGGGLRVEATRRLQALMPASEIFIMYGQTEASARLAYLPPAFLEQKMGSIGKAIPGVELRVRNESGGETAPGEVGEITARGANIMAGYLNDPEGTALAIRQGWLYTGDMAWRDADGFLYVTGRKSDFIKSASYRISPAEIEEAVASYPGVEDAAAIGVPDSLLGEAIAVCVVCPPDVFDAEAIQRHARENLPLHKAPRYVFHEQEIPRTASGKKRYAALREKHAGLEDEMR